MFKKLVAALCLILVFASQGLGEYRQAQVGTKIYETKEAFPIGFYDISHYPSMDARRLDAMREMKRMGADYMAATIDSGDKATIDLAEALNLGLALEYNSDAAGVLEAFKNSPVIFAHIPGDDVDSRFASAAQYKVEDAKYRALRGDLLTIASVGYASNFSKFAGVSDKTGQQCYPIDGEPLAAVPYCYNRAKVATTAKNVPLLAHVQTMKWSGRRYPTPQEIDVMAWGAVILGANEILFYAYFDYNKSNQRTNTDLSTQPAIREKLKQFIEKLRTLQHFFIFGTRSAVTSSSGMVGTWDYPALKRSLDIRVTYSTKMVSITEKAL
jgi:hypothetical protein